MGEFIKIMDTASLSYAAYITYRNTEVDARTTELIEEGHEYPLGSGQMFSLSEKAQINILGIHSWKDTIQYPKKYTTKDNTATISLLNSTEAENFCLNGLATKEGHLATGNDLIDLINACTTIEEAQAIIDER